MSVYVDSLQTCLKSKRWPWPQACHLFAADVEELHELAASIGFRRERFQDHAKLPHYDLSPNKRAKAIGAGAVPVDLHFVVRWMRKGPSDLEVRAYCGALGLRPGAME